MFDWVLAAALGALVTGDPREERLVLNEETLWAGTDAATQSPDAGELLPGFLGVPPLALQRVAHLVGAAADLGFELLESLLLLFFLLTLATIDWETGYLPDRLTWPLLALGLGASALELTPATALGSLVAATLGGGMLWLLQSGYARLRGREGLGGGDVKLVAAAGAW